MRKTTQFKQVVAVLLPVLFLLGMVLTFPKGNSLKADDSEQPFATVKLAGKTETLTDIVVKDNQVEVELVGKKTTLLQLPDHASYDVYQTTEEGTRFAIAEKRITDVDELLKKQASEAEPATSESQETDTSSMKEIESAELLEEGIEPALFHVASENGKGKTYVQVVEGKALTFTIERKSTDEIPLILTSVREEERSQRLFTFEPTASTEATRASKERHSSETSEQTETSTKEAVVSETTSVSSSEAGKQAQATGSSEKTNARTEDPSKQQESETPETYAHVLEVETKPTKKTLEELTSAKYGEADSLKTPLFLENETENSPGLASKAEGPIIVRDVKLTTKTGTASFDANNDPGNDASEGNDIVRTFDQIGYLASFSIQNTKVDTQYTDIRYRVITEMPNAVEVTDTIPRNNGEIANGTYIDKPAGDGSQVSEGVMESVITDSGQVFVPIILNVYGSIHGKQIQPTIQLEIVEAKNVKTGKVETFNKKYDLNDLPNLKTPITKVSAKPSIDVSLVQGETTDSSIFGVSNTNISGYDVGSIITLKPLQGRKTGDYRGSTFPTSTIKFQIVQTGEYTKPGGTIEKLKHNDQNPFVLKATAPALYNRSDATWHKIGTVNTNKLNLPLKSPNGITKKIYTTEPESNYEKIGVYDSGILTAESYEDANAVKRWTQARISSYAGVLNPYTYTMDGSRAQSATDKAFSSMEFIYSWDKTKAEQVAKNNKATSLRMSLSVSYVEYDGMSTAVDTSISYITTFNPSGGYSSIPVVAREVLPGTGLQEYNHKDFQVAGVNPGYKGPHNAGQGNVYQGEELYFGTVLGYGQTDPNAAESIFMWNPLGFEYDNNRKPYVADLVNYYTKSHDLVYKFGVAKDLNSTAPFTHTMSKMTTETTRYNWYNTYEQAKSTGEISAVWTRVNYTKNKSNPGAVGLNTFIPVKVTNSITNKNSDGTNKILMATSRLMKDQLIIAENISLKQNPSDRIDSSGVAHYYPSEFNLDGTRKLLNNGNDMVYWNDVGESVYVMPFHITTKTDVIKSLYQSNEDIDIKVTGVMTGSDAVTYDATLTTILPKGISYKPKSSKDGGKSPLPEPKVILNADGTTTLRWTFSKMTNDQRKKGIEVNFQATSDFTQLIFKDSGYTDSLVVKTVGEMWVTGSPTLNDKSAEGIRSSQDDFIALLIQQVILSKKTNKPFIEVGESDPVGVDNTITYTVKMVNNSASPLPNVRLLDVFPYTGDSRGTKFSGTYTVESATVNDASAKISYTTTAVSDTIDPNSVTGWTNYTIGAASKNAKGLLVSTPSLAVGQEIELTVTLKPTGQKAGDVLVNDAGMNSSLNLPVNSQAVTTKVYSRMLSGIAWYDDDKDGLMHPTGEAKAKDIPVKLYRTSLAKPTYKDQLVKTSLTGESFVDAAGNSTVKTDVNGKYVFTNLPEGNYVAEFVIGDRVTAKEISVTTPNVGTDVTKNSKASQTTFKTPAYKQPLLADLPANTTATNPIYHVPNLHIGLIRTKNPLSITKTLDRKEIEVGDEDPTGVSGKIDNTITYTVKVTNTGDASIPSVRLLDVLPYVKDSRGTTLSGAYTVEDLTVNDSTVWLGYSNTAMADTINPNHAAGFTQYTPGVSSRETIKNAKVIKATKTLGAGASIEIKVKLKPVRQKSGELIKNDASVNTELNGGANAPIRSNIVTTKVYSRILSGIAWYDDDKDGLMHPTGEAKAKDIPVKLYRTSLAKPTYKDQLVKTSLTGESFVDAAGNSTVKTDVNGKYVFTNLPEGNYVAEFVIGDRVTAKEISVTTPNVGTDVTKNSKASQTTFKTPAYKQPLLADLPANTTATNPIYHVPNLHIGLIRTKNPLSITKTLDRKEIEVGDEDPTGVSGKIDNTITYTVKVTNTGDATIPNVRVLDVLPYITDSRGTTLSGAYTIEDFTVNDSTVWLGYSNNALPDDINPLAAAGFSHYNPGTTPKETIKNAKSIIAIKDLAAGASIEMKVKIKPVRQKSGELIKNDAAVNTGLNGGANAPIRSNIVTTKVYSRILSGIAWYDDDKDGLMHPTGEAKAKDIPVKLYRTSLAKPTYKDQLVKTSLTGESFVDAAGNSTVKTDVNGKYVFTNLPEGNYVAEFVIGDRVTAKEFSVTTPNVGTDVTKNSKVNQTTYKTAAYKQPLLADLPTNTTATDPVYHVQYVNLGLVRLNEKLTIKKTVDKSLIEVGDVDPTGVNGLIDNSITYTVTVKNEGNGDVPNVKVLDVLPYLSDSRKTTLTGSYTVQSIAVDSPTAKITYNTNPTVNEAWDPNTLAWAPYIPGTNIEKATAFVISEPQLKVGTALNITIKIKPTRQKAGELIANDASMNNGLNGGANAPIRSNIVTTKVYGRDLTGVAWYDDNKNGLLDAVEPKAKDIPVKLYRTSLAKPTYKDQLVKTSLTGESFVDAAGNSTVKTDANGKYTFKNLPEGNYVAEFVIGDRVTDKEFGVTVPNVGTDPTKNSKASQTTYKTPAYKEPLLVDLPTSTTVTDSVYHVKDVHLGLVLPWSIQLFKYIAGTAVDANNDGLLSEVEKATGTPLQGASFTIYKGTEVNEAAKVGSAVTNKDGKLTFDFLYELDYVLVETKAPVGYELIKEPIHVKSKGSNQTVMVYQEDEPVTKLPFTGGNGPVRLFLLTTGSLFLVGLAGIAWYYRTPRKKGER